jgi:hypothetical protein
MPNRRMKHRRVVHKSTAGILKSIPEAVDPVGNPPPGLTTKTVASLQQRGTTNHTLTWFLGGRLIRSKTKGWGSGNGRPRYIRTSPRSKRATLLESGGHSKLA